MTMMQQAEKNHFEKYGMTPDQAREKFAKEKGFKLENLGKFSMGKQKELHEEYGVWKQQFENKTN